MRKDRYQQMEALWMYQTHNRVKVDLLDKLLASNNDRARAACVRLVSHMMHAIPDHAKRFEKAIHDDHPTVRLEAVRAVSFLRGDDAIEMALGVLDHDMDPYLEYMLEETMRQLEQ